MAPPPLELARSFLASRRIALVGISRDDRDFTRLVLRELLRRGLDVVPVNPALAGRQLEGVPCAAHVREIQPPADAALFFTPAAVTALLVQECVAAGVRKIWFHRGAGPGAATPAAIAFCEAQGIAPVRDLCPFMALPGAGLPHRVHGFLRRVLG